MSDQGHAKWPTKLNSFDVFAQDSSICGWKSLELLSYGLIATIRSKETGIENEFHRLSVPSLVH